MQGSLEQLYPRSRLDYEEYADRIFRTISAQTLDKDKKQGGAACVTVLNSLLQACLSETQPDEVKELAKLVNDQCNKKIEAHNKDIGKVRSKLKGIKMYEDGDGDFSHLEKQEEDDDEETRKAKEEALEEARQRDAEAQKLLQQKAKEREELQQAMKKEARRVDNNLAAQGFKVMKKDDDDMFMGFGGGKKKGKKK